MVHCITLILTCDPFQRSLVEELKDPTLNITDYSKFTVSRMMSLPALHSLWFYVHTALPVSGSIHHTSVLHRLLPIQAGRQAAVRSILSLYIYIYIYIFILYILYIVLFTYIYRHLYDSLALMSSRSLDVSYEDFIGKLTEICENRGEEVG